MVDITLIVVVVVAVVLLFLFLNCNDSSKKSRMNDPPVCTGGLEPCNFQEFCPDSDPVWGGCMTQTDCNRMASMMACYSKDNNLNKKSRMSNSPACTGGLQPCNHNELCPNYPPDWIGCRTPAECSWEAQFSACLNIN
jgi:hypothetical protein